MDELGRPVRRAWPDLLVLAAVLTEAALTVLFEPAPGGLWRGGLMAVLAVALLWRHQHWRWLLPVVLATNALTASLALLVIAVYCYATRSQGRLRTLLVGVLAVAAMATSLLSTGASQAPLGVGASALVVTAEIGRAHV